MSKDVMVPLSLLRDIIALVDGLSDSDCLHFHRAGYSAKLEYGVSLWELKMRVRGIDLTEAYMQTVDGITEGEKRALREWAAGGNSVFDNPYALYDDSGRPMDYINGCRVGADMRENPSDYSFGGADAAAGGEGDEDIPF
jgi:hypothetical protein